MGDGERRDGGIDRKQMEKNTAEIVHTEKKQVGGRESAKLGSHGGWGVVGAALENTKFPSLKPLSLTG